MVIDTYLKNNTNNTLNNESLLDSKINETEDINNITETNRNNNNSKVNTSKCNNNNFVVYLFFKFFYYSTLYDYLSNESIDYLINCITNEFINAKLAKHELYFLENKGFKEYNRIKFKKLL